MTYTFAIRQTLYVTFVLTAAFVVSHYYLHDEAWVVFAAFLVAQASHGAPLREGLSYLVVIVFLLVVAAISVAIVPRVVFSAAGLLALDAINWQSVVMAVLTGGVISLCARLFIFPIPIYAEFKRGLQPILEVTHLFMLKTTAIFADASVSRSEAMEAKNQLEAAFVARQDLYPEWVYRVGFNPGLRAGYRFFLLSLERVADLLISIHYLNSMKVDENLARALSAPLAASMKINAQLIGSVVDQFAAINQVEPLVDYTRDMTELREALRAVIPFSLEILDISRDYVIMSEIVRAMTEMRQVLLQLAVALPA